MVAKYSGCGVQSQHLEEVDLAPAGNSGDWHTREVSYPRPWPPADEFSTPLPRIFVLPDTQEDSPGEVMPVCVVRNVTAIGFTLAARNAAPVPGVSGFSYVAIREGARGSSSVANPKFAYGLARSRLVSAQPLEASRSDLSFALPAGGQAVATPLVFNPATRAAMIAVSARVLATPPRTQSYLRNVDIVSGECGVAIAAFSDDVLQDLPSNEHTLFAPSADPSVQTGVVTNVHFAPAGSSGDWQFPPVDFGEPFLTPPLVFVGTNDFLSVDSDAISAIPRATPILRSNNVVAVAPMAENVTPYGFTIAARNTDLVGGTVGFYWMAIGWSPA